MPKLKNYPKGFNSNFPPSFYLNPPEKNIVSFKETDRIELNFDSIIEEKHLGYKIDRIISDEYSDSFVEIVKQEKIEKPNPTYEKELEQYNNLRKIHDERLAEWNVLKAKWDKESKDEQEKHEMALFLKLKKKFEKQ